MGSSRSSCEMSEVPPGETPPAGTPPPAPASEGTDFNSFYRATVAPLRGYLARLLKSPTDAQDVAQDAYVRVHHASAGTPASKRLLYTVARRLALNHLRGRDRARVRSGDETTLAVAASPDPAVERVVEARHELARLETLILQLPAACRQVFLLRRIHDLTLAEIAGRLGISQKTVESHMTYACRLIRQAYDRAEAEAAVTAEAARRHRANPNP